MSERPHVVVIGGGIAGLACAHALIRPRADRRPPRVTVLEAGERLGGKIHSRPIAGRAIDVGAESLLVRVPAALELCRELDLYDRLVWASTTQTSVWARKRPRELPAGILAGQASVGPVLRSGILSPSGAARASLDLLLPRSRSCSDRSVAALVGGRLGRQALERLVDPLLGTIYAAGCDTLSLRATAPQLEALAREHRSLIAGMRAARGAARPGAPPRESPSRPARSAPAFATLPAGLGSLVERLGERLRDDEAVHIRYGARARRLFRHPEGGYSIVLADGSRLAADAVAIAAPAFAAAEILSVLAPRAAAELAAIRYLSTVLVTLSYPAGAATRPLAAALLVPRRERRLLGACTALSSKWPHLADSGELWLRCSIARHRVEQALAADDAELVRDLRRDLRELLGVGGQPLSAHVTRWREAIPHYQPGHLDRVERIERALDALPAIALAGAAYRGMGVPQCISQGQAAAERLLAATEPRSSVLIGSA